MDTPTPAGAHEQAHQIKSMALPTRIALGTFLAIAAFFLVTEHWAHVWPFLPYLLILACPVMHLFHHHGTGGHDMGKNTPAGPALTTHGDPNGRHH